jgi:hypothetical protein
MQRIIPWRAPIRLAWVTLTIADENRVRTLTLDRPEALNAFNEALVGTRRSSRRAHCRA